MLRRLTYVRSIKDHEHPVRTVVVSSTSGDIVSVSHDDQGSVLMLHSINAQLVAKTTCKQRILALAVSTKPEGTAINIVAGGLNTGAIRLVLLIPQYT